MMGNPTNNVVSPLPHSASLQRHLPLCVNLHLAKRSQPSWDDVSCGWDDVSCGWDDVSCSWDDVSCCWDNDATRSAIKTPKSREHAHFARTNSRNLRLNSVSLM